MTGHLAESRLHTNCGYSEIFEDLEPHCVVLGDSPFKQIDFIGDPIEQIEPP